MHINVSEGPVGKFKLRLIEHFFQEFENCWKINFKVLYGALKFKKVYLFMVILVLRNEAGTIFFYHVQL